MWIVDRRTKILEKGRAMFDHIQLKVKDLKSSKHFYTAALTPLGFTINSLDAALDLLQKLPDSPERIQQEVLLQLEAGPALIALKGYAAPETGWAYTRARELCQRLADPPELSSAL